MHRTILQQRAAARTEKREQLRRQTRTRLAEALRELLPGERVLVFGSLIEPNSFHEHSDVDLALFTEPHGCSLYGLMGQLEERLGRPVDVLLLERCRFKEKIIREGELWTN